MATWGATVGPSGKTVRVGVDLSYSVSGDGSSAVVYSTFYWWSEDPVTDSSNSATISGNGTVPYSGSLNLTTSSSNTTKTVYGTVSTTVALSYGATTTASVSYSQSGVDYIGTGTVASVSASVSLPARPYVAPDSPTGAAVTRVSDTSHTVTWTNTNPAASNKPYSYVTVERSENGGASFSVVSPALTGAPTSFSDQTTVANKRYRYRVQASNSGGYSGYAATADFSTTPATPTGVSAVKNGTAIDVTWANPCVGEFGINVQDNPDGTGWIDVGSAAADATSWTHAAPSSGQTHQYRVIGKSYAPSGAILYGAASSGSNVVQLLTNPGKPTNLAPSGSVFDAADPLLITWTHVGADASPQSAYELQWSTDGGTTWAGTGKVTSTTSSRNLAANLATRPNGLTYQFRVRTWGAYATEPSYSPWSDPVTNQAFAKPVVTITLPGGSIITGNTLTVPWTFAAGGRPQASYLAELRQGSTLLETREVTTSTTSTTFATNLEDSKTYTAKIYAAAGSQWSLPVSVSVSVAYAVPPTPTLTAAWADGGAVLTPTNPAGTPAVITNNFWRKIGPTGEWLKIGTAPPGVVFVDWTASAGLVSYYRVDAVTALPSAASSTVVTVTPPTVGDQARFWLGAGVNFGTLASFRGDPSVRRSTELESVVNHYAGRPLGVPIDGEAVTRTFALDGVLDGDWTLDAVAAFERVILSGKVACYRDTLGQRAFVKAKRVDFDLTNPAAIKVAFTLEEVYWPGEPSASDDITRLIP